MPPYKIVVNAVFEPGTRILRRGKAHKPTEFGQVVKVPGGRGRDRYRHRGRDRGRSRLARAGSTPPPQRVFGRAPRVGGNRPRFLLSPTTTCAMSKPSVSRVPQFPSLAIARPPGSRRERRRPFRRARAWRAAGGEARIARLKHTFGMHRTLYRGRDGVASSGLRPSGQGYRTTSSRSGVTPEPRDGATKPSLPSEPRPFEEGGSTASPEPDFSHRRVV